MTDWVALNARLIAGVETCDPLYRPTNFWQPGLRAIVADLAAPGLASFKSWGSGDFWFYPTYGVGLSRPVARRLHDALLADHPDLKSWAWMRAVNGFHEARRDFDAARLGWDQERWPFELDRFGESAVGKPPQRFRLTDDPEIRWGRPYVNYLLCLAALSQHVDAPPQSFLEIGGGYGVLGEIVMQRDEAARYVDLDIPPLLTVASYYLSTVFGTDRVRRPDAVPAAGPIDVAHAACLPNWRARDLVGPFDVFVNSYSFQEMEPEVVANYVDVVAGLGVRYVVSLNSRAGKPRHVPPPSDAVVAAPGVLDPVTSDRIVAMFEANGFRLLRRYGPPLIYSAGELTVLERVR